MITIIIPLYNKERSIYATVASVLAQTFSEFELLIVNDGSTDRSVEEISRFHDDRIKIINQANKGVSAARNKGILEAKGDWIVFLDADDLLLPYCVEELIKTQKRYDTPIVASNFFIMDKNNRLTTFLRHPMHGLSKNNFKNLFFERFYLRMGNSLFKRDILIKDLFDESLQRYEDFEFFYRLVRKYKVAVSSRELCIHTHEFSDLACLFTFPMRDYITHIELSDKCFWEKMNLSLLLSQGMKIKAYQNYLHIRTRDKICVLISKILEVPVKINKKIHKFLDIAF